MKYLGSFYHVTAEVQRILARLASLERSVSAGGSGGGDAFDDTTGVATLTGNRGWDGAATHNVSISGAEAAIRGDTNIKLVTPGIVDSTVLNNWVLTLINSTTGEVEFTKPRIEQLTVSWIEPTNKTYWMLARIAENATIKRISAQTNTGTCTVQLVTNAGNLSAAVNCSTTLATSVVSLALVAGDFLKIAVSSVASAGDLCVTIDYE